MRLSVKIILGVLTGFIIAIIALLLLGFLYQDKLKALAIDEMNKYIEAPVKVNGGIDVTFISNFPNASVVFNSVEIPDRLRGKKRLLNVGKVSFLFNIYELLSEKVSVNKIIVESGVVNLFKDRKGRFNFDILKPQKDTAASEIELKSVVFKDIQLSWESTNDKIKAKADVDVLNFSGDFGKQKYTLSASSNFIVQQLFIKGDTFTVNKNTYAELLLEIDKSSKRVDFKKSFVEIESNRFLTSGTILYAKGAERIDLNSSCEGNDIADVLELIPAQYANRLSGIKGKGKYSVNFQYQSSARNSTFSFAASLNKGTLDIPKLSGTLENVTSSIQYSSATDVLQVKEFYSEYDKRPLYFDLTVDKLSQESYISMHTRGFLKLESLNQFLTDDNIKDLKGQIEFAEFNLQARLNPNRKLIPESLKLSGKFDIKQTSFTANKVEYGDINGQVYFDGNKLYTQNLTAAFLSSDFSFKGEIGNLLPYIIEKVNRSGNTIMSVNGAVSVKGFDLEKMIAAFKKEQKSEAGKIDIRDIFFMEGNVSLSLDRFKYKNLLFEDINTSLLLSPGRIGLSSFETRTMGGKLFHKGYITFSPNRELIVGGDLKIDQVEITQLFEQADNFDQSTLTSKHIKGKIEADLSFMAVFENYKDFNKEKLAATLNCKIRNGELIGFKPIKVASKFIRVEELNHIYFSDLSNQLIIKDAKVTIPQMEVQSSAINLILSGTHTFDNIIDYHVKVNLRKLLANKFKKNFSNEYIEEDPYEGTNIFLSISGNISKPEVAYDKQFVRKKIQNDFAKEKENLKSLFKKSEAAKPEINDSKEDKYYDTREKPQFIEFEDN